MGTRIVRWALLCGLLTLASATIDQMRSQRTDLTLTLLLCANAALTLLCLGDLLARRSPWCTYWGVRLLAELGHWLFDLFWIGIIAGLVIEIIPLVLPALVLAPPLGASALLVNRFRVNPLPSQKPLPLWI